MQKYNKNGKKMEREINQNDKLHTKILKKLN